MIKAFDKIFIGEKIGALIKILKIGFVKLFIHPAEENLPPNFAKLETPTMPAIPTMPIQK